MWIYEVVTGNLFRDEKDLVGKGYSGHPPHVNDPAAQHIPSTGPIPCGMYSVGPPHQSDHGPYTLSLVPHAGNEMFGRSAFLIHGDLIDAPGKQLASLGCIIQSRDVREAIWKSGDHVLKVVERINGL